MPARRLPSWHQMVIPVFSDLSRRSELRSIAGGGQALCDEASEQILSHDADKADARAERDRLNAVMALDPPSVTPKPFASFSFSNSSCAMPSTSRSTLASPATMQSRSAMDAYSLHHACDHAVGTGIVRI